MMRLRLDLTLPLNAASRLRVELDEERRCWALAGPSGSGKSSLLRALAGVESRATGRIEVNGTPWLEAKGRRERPASERRVGWSPQEAFLFPHLSVAENLSFSPRRGSTLSREAVIEALELSALVHRQPRHLSGGERQRVALGRALLSSPQLLLLDEPFSALDRPLRRRLIDRVSAFLREHAIAAIIVSHDLTDLTGVIDGLWEIENGWVQSKPVT